ncbi:polysaccharide biosynthesis tyrosine autokinase [Actinomyces sp. MRS3W]|uniref:polysaccharide biosynthesis tyrosine autokinase n=1 Tax=Actinomyces sp. MRS3W TaxID=2800796 RepID=UPI0028FD9F63|nr:polysaccharide biosynthesis tyrosine autokinase [Actinomyces sp. MRS3W]MDU0348880.1 polysaccharide biosynthesis tyrosine autokinase [Actinomyces sp. MRS3W]
MTIQDFVRVTRVNLVVIVLCTLLGGFLGFGYAQLQPKTYSATTSALVVVGGTDAFTSNSIAQQKANAFASLTASQPVAERVSTSLGLDGLGGSLSGTPDAATPIIWITATSSDPARARDIANAAVVALGEEIASLESLSAGSTTQTDSGTGTEDSTAPTSTTLVALEQAALPTSPISPDVRKLVLAGLAGGLVLGYAIAFLRRALDNKVRHNSDVEELLGSSVLAVVPRSNELNEKGRRQVDGLGDAAEALRHLRTNLRFLDVDNPPRAIVMTSANAGEGKSTISAVLAQMLAASGQRTILVDADLRKPVVHKIFGVDGAVGLTQVLAGDVSIADVARAIPDQPHLRVIPAGRIPPNPSELLGSQRMKALLDRLTEEATVILDAPPLLPVTDAGLLTGLADGAILVLAVGGTYKEQARLCGKVLAQVDGRLLGVVLNRASRRALGSVYYGYGYGGYGQGYYQQTERRKLLGIIPLPGKRRSRPSMGDIVVDESPRSGSARRSTSAAESAHSQAGQTTTTEAPAPPTAVSVSAATTASGASGENPAPTRRSRRRH